MKQYRITRLIFFLLLPVLSCDTKGDFEGDFENYFVKYYGDEGDQEAADFFLNDDGSSLLLGTSVAAGQSRIFLVKVDAVGRILWQRKLGGINENAQDIEPTVDGGFLILSNVFKGKDLATNEDLFDYKVIKINADGSKVDSVLSTSLSTQFMRSVTPLTKNGLDDGFFVTGNSTDENIITDVSLQTPPPDQEDLIVVRYNSDFDEVLRNTSTSSEHVGTGVKVFQNGDFHYLFTWSDTENVSNVEIKSSANFHVYSIENSNPFLPFKPSAGSASGDEVLQKVVKDPFTNGYFELGTQVTLPQTRGYIYFARRTNDFSLTNQGVINASGADLTAAAVYPSTAKGGYLILAEEMVTAGQVLRLMFVEESAATTPSPLWSVSFGSVSGDNSGAGVAELADGRILVFGTIELETQKKMALIKVNAQGKFSD